MTNKCYSLVQISGIKNVSIINVQDDDNNRCITVTDLFRRFIFLKMNIGQQFEIYTWKYVQIQCEQAQSLPEKMFTEAFLLILACLKKYNKYLKQFCTFFLHMSKHPVNKSFLAPKSFFHLFWWEPTLSYYNSWKDLWGTFTRFKALGVTGIILLCK